ncbi:ROK family protein [Oceanospirillum linum]|uniref:Fructokinase n=1 Tax=Oceanospirillum linum TaxID=966 RepID=A0A1T1H9L8_OCELI|nr:ROK family protein [Oceanospirillum linum]OOV86533.1 hypothetical protein BTA35_0213640 [Oceanospirillum linum]SEG36003.1 N-acetylglucosamine kinase [Oleiphilus messinensis]SMP29988.1 N-acetylglucosamine kinase [Oceanospirillum linum]
MYLGIDLGGTKIEAVVLSGEKADKPGAILFRKRIATPAENYSGTLEAIAGLVAEADKQFGPFDRVGLGTPGAVSAKTGLMMNCNSTCLNGEPLVEDLELRLGKKVTQANDANCFALSEAIDGSARGYRIVFGVILGTGVGGGIVIDGKVLPGLNRIAGEWGHNRMPASVLSDDDRRACYCGRINCVETYLSGPGFANTYRSLELAENAVFDGKLTAREIAILLARKDARADRALDIYSKQLAAALSEAINILDPDIIVLGGGMSNVKELYARVAYWLPEFVFSDVVETNIRSPEYGDSSGVRGAAWLTKHRV